MLAIFVECAILIWKLTEEIIMTGEQKAAYLSARNVAARYQITVSCVHKWIKANKIPSPIKINGTSRWRLEDLELWELTHK